MRVKKMSVRLMLFLCAATLLAMPLMGCTNSGAPSATAEKTVKSVTADTPWLVTETTRLSELTIADGGAVTAPEGRSVTLTVDGVETGIKAGTYKGDVVLTVTENIAVTETTFNKTATFNLRAAIHVENGTHVPGKSVTAAVAGGTVSDTAASDVSITSTGESFNGIVIAGNSTYTIDKAKIRFTGNGANDFVGVGAGILVKDTAVVTVNGADFVSDGVIRQAVCATGKSTITVNDSKIETGSPELPETVTGMMSVPWVLGLTGTCRSTMATGSATANYNNTLIRAKAWGALSTDAVKDVKLTATGCTIEVIDSGYGAYADGNSVDTFRGCTFNVKDYALIMTQGSGVFTDGTVVNSGRFGVMSHSGRGNEKLVIEKGCVFNTGEAAIQLKSSAPEIIVDNATFNSKNGIILQAMENDDPLAGGSPQGGMPVGTEGGMPGGGGAPQTAAPAGGAPPSGGTGALPDMAQGGMPIGTGGGGSSDVHATFKNATLTGDIITSMTKLGDMTVTFENVTIKGAITTAAWKSSAASEGVDAGAFGAFSREAYKYAYLIGAGTSTYCATDDTYGLSVSLDGKSKWTVDKTSYLTSLSMADGAIVAAAEGYALIMTVDGENKPVAPGEYKGKITLTVSQK